MIQFIQYSKVVVVITGLQIITLIIRYQKSSNKLVKKKAMKAVPDVVFEKITLLLIFLIIVINELFLISLTVIILKKLKMIIRSPGKKYYYFVIFYIVSKLSLCIFLQIKILVGIPSEFKNLSQNTIENIFDNSIVFADCSIIELFLISFEHYIALSFSVFGNQQIQKSIRLLMKGIQVGVFLMLLIPLLLFNISVITYPTLNIFTMSLNCLSVIVFIGTFFFMNFKMTGLMMDQQSSEIIKRVYTLLLTLLVSRFVVSVLQVWIYANINEDGFEGFIINLANNQDKYVVLGLCFILYLVVMLLTEGFPLIMSLRETVVTAITQIKDFCQQSQPLPSSQIKQNLIEDLNLTESQIIIKDREKSQLHLKSDSICEVNKIKSADELTVEEKISKISQDFLVYKAKSTKSQKLFLVKQFKNISNYIIEELVKQTKRYMLNGCIVFNPIKILQKSQGNKVLIIQKYLPQSLQIKMNFMLQNGIALKQKINLALKISKAIKQFHDSFKIGHGVLNPKNIIFDQQFNVFLTGFGMESLKKYLSLTTQYSNITMYTAVQLLGTTRQNIISKPQKKADIYSFGIILYEMVSNNFNYRNESISQIRKKFEKQNTRPKIPSQLNQDLKKILRKCWVQKPQNRPQITEIIVYLQNLQSSL